MQLIKLLPRTKKPVNTNGSTGPAMRLIQDSVMYLIGFFTESDDFGSLPDQSSLGEVIPGSLKYG